MRRSTSNGDQDTSRRHCHSGCASAGTDPGVSGPSRGGRGDRADAAAAHAADRVSRGGDVHPDPRLRYRGAHPAGAPGADFHCGVTRGLPQTRYLCRHLHREFPALHIVVGYWGNKEEFDKVLVRLRQVGASSLTTSLLQSRSRIRALMAEVTAPASTPLLEHQAMAGP